MSDLYPGDLVKKAGADFEMMIISEADDLTSPLLHHPLKFNCAWQQDDLLCEEIVLAEHLILVRRERRRIPRAGNLEFPKRVSPSLRLAGQQ